MDNLEKYDQMMAEIRRDYLDKLSDISDKMKALSLEPSLCITDSQAFSEMKTIAHNLHGSAGTFGFKQISEAATPLDRFLTDLKHGRQGEPIDDQTMERARILISELITRVDESLMGDGC
ncbi:Hpt domain-containing protein [Endozoicomonas sp.]|uniref:Hpt domain-containing protein n=1 Tax=Endozoicomonas sp. TaxID=1892382 RepID=UPI003AF5FCA4